MWVLAWWPRATFPPVASRYSLLGALFKWQASTCTLSRTELYGSHHLILDCMNTIPSIPTRLAMVAVDTLHISTALFPTGLQWQAQLSGKRLDTGASTGCAPWHQKQPAVPPYQLVSPGRWPRPALTWGQLPQSGIHSSARRVPGKSWGQSQEPAWGCIRMLGRSNPDGTSGVCQPVEGWSPRGNNKPLDSAHWRPGISTSSPTIAMEGLPGALKVRWGQESAAQWPLRASGKGEPWRDCLQCPHTPAVRLRNQSSPTGDKRHVWPEASPPGNMLRPWDTWSTGCLERPWGKRAQ